MHVHILGICGTFMGSLALLARAKGHTVTGSDEHVYPPMSTQLAQAGVDIMQGYAAAHLQPHPDLVIVGNAMKRGIDAVEYMLDAHIPYTSGPQFLAEHILPNKRVLAVAGTHGKTTTSTMLAWVLEHAGKNPGFLIGGVPLGFTHSARLGGDYFVVEADEYDSAFFDKRSKFVHYKPDTAILNNLEFDHADIFENLAAIQKQFHHLVRTIPKSGCIIAPVGVRAIDEVLDMGCWTAVSRMDVGSTPPAIGWFAQMQALDGSVFEVFLDGKTVGVVSWGLSGTHNVSNGLAAIAAAASVGVAPEQACAGLSVFHGVKRRMELLATVGGIEVYDDFAHHPTAIETTLEGARNKIGKRKLWAIIEPRSNTMRLGHHKAELALSTQQANEVIWYEPAGIDWDLASVVAQSPVQACVKQDLADVINYVVNHAVSGDVVVIMSNGGFGGLHQKLITALTAAHGK